MNLGSEAIVQDERLARATTDELSLRTASRHSHFLAELFPSYILLELSIPT